MPYVGGSLTTLFNAPAQLATRVALQRMCAKGVDRMADVAVVNTPVKTGRLRTSWYQTPVHPASTADGRTGVAAEIRNDVRYAAFVEYGTGKWGPQHRPYPIVPKTPGGTLAWRDPHSGRWVHAKKVMHPGSPGNHMVALAAHVVEAEIEGGLFGSVLDAWARAIEAGAH